MINYSEPEIQELIESQYDNGYNNGIETAISIIKEFSYIDCYETLLCALENSKKD